MISLLPGTDDLSILDIDGQGFVRHSVIRTVATCLATVVGVAVVDGIVADIPIAVMSTFVVGATYLAWTTPLRRIRERAETKRSDMDLAVAVFLDLVNVLLAGGAGVETAMLASASAGDGWAFEQIRLALARARSSRCSYWDALSDLGATLRVESLEDVAHSVQLAGEHGARVRQSLAAKAQALRARNLARIEHEAEQRTEHMGLPIVILFIGFILLVGYPAFAGTIAGL